MKRPVSPSRKTSVRWPKATVPVWAARCSARLADKMTRQVSAIKKRLSDEIALLAHQPASFRSSETNAAAMTPWIRAICSKALFTTPFHVLVPQVLVRPCRIEDGVADTQVIGHEHLLEMRPEQRHLVEIINLQGHGDVGQLAIEERGDEGAAIRLGHLRAFHQFSHEINFPVRVDHWKRGLPFGGKFGLPLDVERR